MNLETLYPQLKSKFYVYNGYTTHPLSVMYGCDWLDYLHKYIAARKILARKRPDLEQRKLTTEVNVLKSLTQKHRESMKHFHALRRAAKKEERKTRKEK